MTQRQWILYSIAFAALLAALLFQGSKWVQLLDSKIYDSFLQIRGSEKPRSPIVILAVDDPSIRILNRKWQWDRTIFARALSELKKQNPRIILLDFIFSEPGSESEDQAFNESLKKLSPIRALAGISLSQQITRKGAPGQKSSYILIEKNIVLPLFPSLIPGYLNIENDDDATIRRTSLTRDFEGKKYYSLAFQALRILAPQDFESRLEAIRGNPDNELIINFRGPDKSFSRVSFYQLALNLLPHDFFRDKIVLIGPTFDDSQDFYFTPFFEYQGLKNKMAGIEIHANILDNLLSGTDFKKLSFLIAALLFFLITFLMPPLFSGFLPSRLSLFIGGGLGAAYLFCAYLLMSIAHCLLPVTLPIILLVFLTFVFARMNNYWKQKEMQQEIQSIKADENYQLEAFCAKHDLSRREKEVLVLMIQDMSNAQISKKLFISLSTVKSHISALYRKADIKTREELMDLICQTKI